MSSETLLPAAQNAPSTQRYERYWDDPKAKVLFGLFVVAVAAIVAGGLACGGAPFLATLGITVLTGKWIIAWGTLAALWVGFFAIENLAPKWSKEHQFFMFVSGVILVFATLVMLGACGGVVGSTAIVGQ